MARKVNIIVRLFGNGVVIEGLDSETTVEQVRYLIKPNNTKAPKLDFYEASLEFHCKNFQGILKGEVTVGQLSKANDDVGVGKYGGYLDIYAVVNKEIKAECQKIEAEEKRAKLVAGGHSLDYDLGPKWRSLYVEGRTEENRSSLGLSNERAVSMQKLKVTVIHQIKDSPTHEETRETIEISKGAKAKDLCDDLTRGGPVENIRKRLKLKRPTAYREGPPLDRVQGLIDTRNESLGVLKGDELLVDGGEYILHVVEDITVGLCMEPRCRMIEREGPQEIAAFGQEESDDSDGIYG